MSNNKQKINFHTVSLAFHLKEKTKLKSWIAKVVKEENGRINELNFIFCSDEYLLQINQTYLQHNSFTDIITFDYNQEFEQERKKTREKNKVSSKMLKKDISPLFGDIFISVERVRENADKFYISFEDELHRVMIHGVLHLVGYTDKIAAAKKVMKSKEDYYLSFLS